MSAELKLANVIDRAFEGIFSPLPRQKQCENCGKKVFSAVTINGGSKDVCASCYADFCSYKLIARCDHCDEEYLIDDMTIANGTSWADEYDGDRVCKPCAVDK